ncbi:hypothetical protein [Fusobacterium phage Fnu1]|uniref:Uncharacterized protein n=1 Tax=Fusobacterium phage Fnu1 TaxID=2530024 RepID=A0A481W7N5_9CAUD|nr:hypothetical protein KMD24_gp075 [Fusobacterium phage Fnu1]QBJ04225.1 hypothetical protein [Fusobacterium phage Fnu1]
MRNKEEIREEINDLVDELMLEVKDLCNEINTSNNKDNINATNQRIQIYYAKIQTLKGVIGG